MSSRNKTSKQFAEVISDLKSITLDFNDVRRIRNKMREMLIESLAPAERTTYYFIEIQMKENPVTAADVSYAYSYKINYASSLLKSLWSLGLLKREQVNDEHGKHYEYRLNP